MLPSDAFLNYSVPNRSSRHKTPSVGKSQRHAVAMVAGYPQQQQSPASASATVIRSPAHGGAIQPVGSSPGASNEVTRRRGLLTSFGKGFAAMMGTGGFSSTSAPNLGESLVPPSGRSMRCVPVVS